MPYDWPEDTDFAFWELDVTDRNCPRLRTDDARL